MFCRITCDSRETVPLTLALFLLADGDVEKCVTYGANFGRDADTIASMAGAIAGALRGVGGIRPEWVEKANRLSGSVSVQLAEGLVKVAMRKAEAERSGGAASGDRLVEIKASAAQTSAGPPIAISRERAVTRRRDACCCGRSGARARSTRRSEPGIARTA